MTNLVLFFNSFISYLLVFVIFVVLVIVAVIIGIKIKKAKMIKEEQQVLDKKE